VPTPVQPLNRYKADLREYFFLLFEQFKLGNILGKPPFSAWGEDEIRAALTECYRWVRDVTGPLNALGDAEGCALQDGHVKTPDGFKAAWTKLYEAGWKSIAIDEEYGGAGAPRAVQVLVEELLSGSNTAFNMYPALAIGAAEVIESFGTADQRSLYCSRMFSGQWGGTMCLTEPNAGSDVGASLSSAKKNPDGTYFITGTKVFISGGDHDLAENIVHLVLARVEGAPAGTKGLTLFIIPKIHVNEDATLGEPNDVKVTGIEHKMGINGSATCALSFGEEGRCQGVPVGADAGVNHGMAQMFKMMNGARIAVGIQGVSVASSAFLNALEYARERKQGSSIEHWKDATAPRVPIVQHPDVRRMLLDMKARVEGIRALAVKLAHHQDCARALAETDKPKSLYHQGQVDLLVPLVKAYGSDQAFRVCETAIQTFGGAGYTRDVPVEQSCRDAKIFSIYEGTNHIQAMDLVGRKLEQAGGSNLKAFLADVAGFVAVHGDHAVLGAAVKRLGLAQEAFGRSAMKLLSWFQSGQVAMVPLYANRFLAMMSEVAVAWLLLDGAVTAHAASKSVTPGHPDASFYAGKVQAALYYARTDLPNVEHAARSMADEDRSPLDIPEAAFATV
jgi:alkylation response protein AidB-like acyl-CoA dehydrogenase